MKYSSHNRETRGVMTGPEYHDKVIAATSAAETAMAMSPAVDCTAAPYIVLAIKAGLECHKAQAEYQSNGQGQDIADKTAIALKKLLPDMLSEGRTLPEISIWGGKILRIKNMKARDAMRLIELIAIVGVLVMGALIFTDVIHIRQNLQAPNLDHAEVTE